jgi:opacity protein-like surface antigen
MIKKSLAMASLLALGTSAMAIDVQPYIGAGAGVSFGKTEVTVNTPGYVYLGDESERKSSASLILKGGAILDSSHRLSLSYAPSFHSDANVHNVMAGYDYLIPLNDKNKLYVGAHAGVSSFKGKDEISDYSMSGFAYGAQTGYIYDITKNIEFEFGLNYTKHDLDKTGTMRANNGNPVSVKLEMKDSISTFAGINYKF